MEALQLLLETAANPTLSQIVPIEKLAVCWNKVVSNSGVEDPEGLIVDPEEIAENNQPQSEEQAIGQTEEPVDESGGNELADENKDETTDFQTEQLESDPAIENVVSMLRDKGIPDKTIVDAIHAVQDGVPPEQVATQLERLVNGR